MVNSTTPIQRYYYDADVDIYGFSFDYQLTSDIQVYAIDENSNKTTLAENVDYVVAGQSIRLLDPESITATWLVIQRLADAVQDTELNNGQYIDVKAIEEALDTMVMRIQELQLAMNNTLQNAPEDWAEDTTPILPPIETRKNAVLYFLEDGLTMAALPWEDVQAIQDQTKAYMELAQEWASKTDGPVEGTTYSAKYYALQAELSKDITLEAQTKTESAASNASKLVSDALLAANKAVDAYKAAKAVSEDVSAMESNVATMQEDIEAVQSSVKADLESVESLTEEAKGYSEAAATSEANAKESEEAAAASEEEAALSRDKALEAATKVDSLISTAQQIASNALLAANKTIEAYKAAEAVAVDVENAKAAAETARDNAESYATAAASSASKAASSAEDAAASEDAALASQEAAATSEAQALSYRNSASSFKDQAVSSAESAAETLSAIEELKTQISAMAGQTVNDQIIVDGTDMYRVSTYIKNGRPFRCLEKIEQTEEEANG